MEIELSIWTSSLIADNVIRSLGIFGKKEDCQYYFQIYIQTYFPTFQRPFSQ